MKTTELIEVELEGKTVLGVRIDARYRRLGSGKFKYWQLVAVLYWMDGKPSITGWSRCTARRRKNLAGWPPVVFKNDLLWERLEKARK